MRMAKRILPLFLLAFIYTASFGQFLIGVNGGYSFSGVHFNPGRAEKPLMNPLPNFGITAKFFDLKYVGIQTELNYTQRGFQMPISEVITYKRLSSYIELPLYFQVRASAHGFFGHVNLGFNPSLLIGSKHGQDSIVNFELTNYRINILRDNIFDFGLLGGVGLGYDFKRFTIQFDVRYYYGMGDLYYYNFSGNPLRSSAWAVDTSLSLMVNLTKKRKNRLPHEDSTLEKGKFENTNQ